MSTKDTYSHQTGQNRFDEDSRLSVLSRDQERDICDEGMDEGRGAEKKPLPKESGGPSGPEPTRYGDWEKGGRCIDF